jgi:hypothetical protein
MGNIIPVPGEEATMDDMPQTPAHAKPKDHLWVLAVIAACALIETFPSWVGIGAVSGFPHFGRMPTDWTLAVTSEAYWGYALYAGVVAVAGPRSRAFALWSAGGVFILSLMGQASYHLMAAAHRAAPPQWVVVFVAALPVIVLALIAVLVHLRHIDRAEVLAAEEAAIAAAREAAEAAAAADERTALRVQVEAQGEALSAAQSGLAEAQRETAEAQARVDALTRKLAASAGARNNRKAPAKRGSAVPATRVPRNVDVQAEALTIITAEPGISGAALAERVGRCARWGETFKKNFATAAPAGPDAKDVAP